MVPSRITKKQLVKFHKEKATDQKIADSIGVTRQAIHQMRVKHGIPKATGRFDARDKEIFKRFKRGDKVNSISTESDISIPQVYRIVKRMSNKQKKAG